MLNQKPMSGVIAPILTPFDTRLNFVSELYVRHARRLLDNGIHYIAPFGTTGEALSTALAERIRAVDALLDGGIEAARLMPGAGLCNLPETVELVRHAVDRGCAAVMLLPPFFYKNPDDEGLYRYFAELIERVANPALKICLYHIPPTAVVGFSPPLAGRLARDFPATVIAYKDSSGDFANTQAVVAAAPDLAVFPGAETFLEPGLAQGCAGCISATCNINPGGIRRVFDLATGADAGELRAAAEDMLQIRRQVEGYAPIPLMKAVLATQYDEPEWGNVRPPLLQYEGAEARNLAARLGFC